MTEKEAFIKVVSGLFINETDNSSEEFELARNYFSKLQNGGGDSGKPAFTEKGIVILKYLKENPDAVLPAKKIAEDLDLSSRTVSGAMKKLVSDGYVDKFEGEPKTYSITIKGKEVEIEEK